MTILERAYALRDKIESCASTLDDDAALKYVELFPSYVKLLEEKAQVIKGFRFQHDGQLWRIEQPTFTFDGTYVPGSDGLESLFSKVADSKAGAKSNPIAYEQNMEIYEGKYYTQYDVLYLCIYSSGQPLYHDLSALVGLYVQPAE